jgi:hypothetical protein
MAGPLAVSWWPSNTIGPATPSGERNDEAVCSVLTPFTRQPLKYDETYIYPDSTDANDTTDTIDITDAKTHQLANNRINARL